MEEVFHYISKNFVTVDKKKMRNVRPIVKNVINKITNEMKSMSPLFKTMFESYSLIGSVYDGLKVGNPDEFDIDLKLFLPKKLDLEVQVSNIPGFVNLYLKGYKNYDYNQNYEYGELSNFITNDHYLSQEEMKFWMERIIKKAINRIKQNGELGRDIRNIKYETREPAVTLRMETYYDTEISVDLVSVIRIPGQIEFDPLVRENFRQKKLNYFVVPETPRHVNSDNPKELEKYWRLSFPEQELEYMHNLYTLKPIIRFVKKLRDTHQHNIPSYFIKTIFLWEIKSRDRSFWQASFVDIFIEILFANAINYVSNRLLLTAMLKTYKNYIASHEIPYFWNAGHNLIEPDSSVHMDNIKDDLEEIIFDIENSRYTEPLVLAYYLLPAEEFEVIRQHFLGFF